MVTMMADIALVGGGEGICSGGQVNVGPWGKSWLLSGGDGYTSYWEHYPDNKPQGSLSPLLTPFTCSSSSSLS